MKTRLFSALVVSALLVTACNTIKVRTDTAPAPVDPSIRQERLEFSGCGVDSQLGTIACLPGQTLGVVTEFAGDVIYFSPDQDCSLNLQVRATTPITQLKLPTFPKVCDVMVLYVPEYIKAGSSQEKIYGLAGEVSMMGDADYTPVGNYSIRVDETLSLQFPGAVSGIYIGRQMSDPVKFTGEQLQYKPTVIGNDLLFIKLTMQDGTVQKRIVPGTYYSASALDLLFDIQTTGKKITLTFPTEVSVVTVTGKKPTSNLTISLSPVFTGYVRAYTAKGRTSVAYFEDGDLKWTR